MKTPIKKWGDSMILILSKDFMKFHKAKIGDWVDMDCVVIIPKEISESINCKVGEHDIKN